MLHIFSLVCFLIDGVKRRQVLIPKPRFFRFYTLYMFINNFMIFHQNETRLKINDGGGRGSYKGVDMTMCLINFYFYLIVNDNKHIE